MAKLILASGSETRRRLLRAAGINPRIVPPEVNEASMKHEARIDHCSVAECAVRLANIKAWEVSKRHPRVLVIGADQMLEKDGVWFDKPGDVASARLQLLSLRGGSHRLATAAALVRNGEVIWQTVDTAVMTMRGWSDAFLDEYLRSAGPSVVQSVGSYHLEGCGIQLFDRIEGDYFTILGLPLLPLLAALRREWSLTA